jgi:hypothetical protein
MNLGMCPLSMFCPRVLNIFCTLTNFTTHLTHLTTGDLSGAALGAAAVGDQRHPNTFEEVYYTFKDVYYTFNNIYCTFNALLTNFTTYLTHC